MQRAKNLGLAAAGLADLGAGPTTT
jgi:hypothetical protein